MEMSTGLSIVFSINFIITKIKITVMKNIISLSLVFLLFANLSFAQKTAKQQRVAIFDKAQADIFCATAKQVFKNIGSNKGDEIPCRSITSIYNYLGDKTQRNGKSGGNKALGNGITIYTIFSKAKGRLRLLI